MTHKIVQFALSRSSLILALKENEQEQRYRRASYLLIKTTRKSLISCRFPSFGHVAKIRIQQSKQSIDIPLPPLSIYMQSAEKAND